MILLKVDRASMYNSLEVRVPLLDKEVVETALRVDWRSCLDLSSNTGKPPWRNSLSRSIAHQTRTKRGFTVPMADWSRGPLREMCETLVLQRKELVGLPLNRVALTDLFRQHLTGEVERAWELWTLLSLALWEERCFRR